MIIIIIMLIIIIQNNPKTEVQSLSNWCSENNLTLNVRKTRKLEGFWKTGPTLHNWRMSGNELHLGVWALTSPDETNTGPLYKVLVKSSTVAALQPQDKQPEQEAATRLLPLLRVCQLIVLLVFMVHSWRLEDRGQDHQCCRHLSTSCCLRNTRAHHSRGLALCPFPAWPCGSRSRSIQSHTSRLTNSQIIHGETQSLTKIHFNCVFFGLCLYSLLIILCALYIGNESISYPILL